MQLDESVLGHPEPIPARVGILHPHHVDPCTSDRALKMQL